MSRAIDLVSYNVAGNGLSAVICLPCSGVSGQAVNVSHHFCRFEYKILPQAKLASLKCASRRSLFVCQANPGDQKRNSNFSRNSKYRFSRSTNRRNGERESPENEDRELIPSKNGSLLTLSTTPKFQATATVGPREKEIVGILRKVQAQLRESAAIKEEKNEKEKEDSQDRSKGSERVNSLLRLLRGHYDQRGKISHGSGSNKGFVVDQPEDNSPFDGEKNTSSINSKNQDHESPSPSRPVSNFHRRSPVPHVKFESINSDAKTIDCFSCTNVDKKREKSLTELETEPEPEIEHETEAEPTTSHGDVLDEMSSHGIPVTAEGYSDDDVEEQERARNVDLRAMKLPELRAVAKSRSIYGFSKLKKQELLELLSEAQFDFWVASEVK